MLNSIMTKVLIVDKLTTIKEQEIDNIHDLYKKCGFRKVNGFEKHHTWVVNLNNKTYRVSVFGKTDGRAGMENKYELPPPIDNTLFFGKIAIVIEDDILSIELWNKIYEKLFGGFINLEDTDGEEEEDELDEYPDEMKTKTGYLKDDFVVSDNELEEEEYYLTGEEN